MAPLLLYLFSVSYLFNEVVFMLYLLCVIHSNARGPDSRYIKTDKADIYILKTMFFNVEFTFYTLSINVTAMNYEDI